MTKEFYMREALLEAQKAYDKGEVPIGAVLVKDGKIIGRGHNLRELSQDPTTHAEVLAIKDASQQLDSWRLTDTALYVTLEPCPMCCGALILSRVSKVYYGASDAKAGCAGTLMNLLTDTRFNHQLEVEAGVLESECQLLLKQFFKDLRQQRKGNSRKPKQADSK